MSDQYEWAKSLKSAIVFNSWDWGAAHRDAWIYGIVVGWDDDALKELAEKHSWSTETVSKLKMLHENFELCAKIPKADIGALYMRFEAEAQMSDMVNYGKLDESLNYSLRRYTSLSNDTVDKIVLQMMEIVKMSEVKKDSDPREVLIDLSKISSGVDFDIKHTVDENVGVTPPADLRGSKIDYVRSYPTPPEMNEKALMESAISKKVDILTFTGVYRGKLATFYVLGSTCNSARLAIEQLGFSSGKVVRVPYDLGFGLIFKVGE